VAQALLLTGPPRVGKTTIIRKVAERLGDRAGGFYTEEVRSGGQRTGFRIVTLDGKEALLSSVRFPGPLRIGKYGVDVAALDRVGVQALRQAIQRGQIVVVDEIGKMELFSEAFKAAVLEALDGASPVVGTILSKPYPWADQLKARPDVRVVEVTWENRDALVEAVLEQIQDTLAVKARAREPVQRGVTNGRSA
jgi:nucleoside-triphosphatase